MDPQHYFSLKLVFWIGIVLANPDPDQGVLLNPNSRPMFSIIKIEQIKRLRKFLIFRQKNAMYYF
jgi:hypothetical protein